MPQPADPASQPPGALRLLRLLAEGAPASELTTVEDAGEARELALRVRAAFDTRRRREAELTALVERQVADQARTHGIAESEVLEQVMMAPVAVKRLVEPEEVADLVAFLCGPSGASVTGSSFSMDGGWTAH